MKSFLLFVAALAGMLALVPLSTLAATGSWAATWRTIREYGFVLMILFVIPMAAGLLIAGFCLLVGIDPT